MIALVFVLRLVFLQIISSDYKKYADSNAFLKKTIYPSRGLLYDRYGKLLVFNKPTYDIMVILREVQDFDTLDFCRTIGSNVSAFHSDTSFWLSPIANSLPSGENATA